MEISKVNNYNVNFSGQKKKIQQADNLMRLSCRVFPCISSSHIREYKTFKKDNPYLDSYYSLEDRISLVRNRYFFDDEEYLKKQNDLALRTKQNISYYPNVNNELSRLMKIKELKAGNCAETVRCMMAILAANNIYNFKPASLKLNVRFINKLTGKIEYETFKNIDHVCVLTNLDNNFDTKGYKYVIDPWLTFASSKEKAIDKYYGYFNEKIQSQFENAKKGFSLNRYFKVNKIKDSDCNIQANLILEPKGINMWQEEWKDLGNYTRELFLTEKTNNKKNG